MQKPWLTKPTSLLLSLFGFLPLAKVHFGRDSKSGHKRGTPPFTQHGTDQRVLVFLGEASSRSRSGSTFDRRVPKFLHLVKTLFYFPLLLLEVIYHYWTYYFFHGLQHMEEFGWMSAICWPGAAFTGIPARRRLGQPDSRKHAEETAPNGSICLHLAGAIGRE